MKNEFIVIAGTGYRVNNDFDFSENIFESKNAKINIGCAIAKYLAEKGFNLILVSTTESKLKKIQHDIHELYPNVIIECFAINILDEKTTEVFFDGLLHDRTYTYIHCAGLSAGNYKLKNDNPYLPIEEIPVDLPIEEFTSVVKSLLLMVRGFLPFFNKQKLSKVIVVNSMSGTRSYPYGFSHSSAKGGLHNAVRSLSLELAKRNIYFSEIMPGIVDTGMYDSDIVIDTVKKIGREFGYDYNDLPQMNPLAIAEIVHTCIISDANILSVSVVPNGQWPHTGA